MYSICLVFWWKYKATFNPLKEGVTILHNDLNCSDLLGVFGHFLGPFKRPNSVAMAYWCLLYSRDRSFFFLLTAFQTYLLSIYCFAYEKAFFTYEESKNASDKRRSRLLPCCFIFQSFLKSHNVFPQCRKDQ